MSLSRIILCFLLSTGCVDYSLTKQHDAPEEGTTAPEIQVDPIQHSFGALSAGSEVHDVVITIENIGNGDLDISSIYLQNGSSNFSLVAVPTGVVEPTSSVDLIVSYAPGTYEANADIIHILSNDEDEPDVEVLLDGTGDAPVIVVDPDYFDLGTVYLGCDETTTVNVSNAGNSSLILGDVEYFSSVPVDFSLQDFITIYGSLPITIAPGDSIDLVVDYTPLDTLDDSAYIEITSNDPATPIAYADHDGLGDYEKWVTDSFAQDGDARVDILFVVDNSGSMGGNQTNLKNNFDDFIAVFVGAGVDFQIAIITTDSPTFVGSVITSSTPDPITEFENQINSIGTTGSAYEKGLWYSYTSTSSGGDASPGSSTGFLRESAKLVVVYVSDEADYSHQTYGSGGSTSMTPADYTAHLQTLKTSSDLVIAHAVAGDYPGGCTANGGAQFGDGYYDVVNDLGGTFMSICAEDWSVTMDTLARESMAQVLFELTEDPVEDTISVSVNGYMSTDWSYDSSLNAVTFGTPPADESTIDITYASWAECATDTSGSSE